ncbi:hypothetical protein D0Z00_002634 [Geotrichum galactomycetum]|uniref:Uncharacterized protein n=1 Tax=Geotrichum galactomycetum TaxID=27317 RepID=A0ACB6V3J9_9ASCO|nr:hypothetical protein D0Z00_002634 [Geotrichum candidum]
MRSFIKSHRRTNSDEAEAEVVGDSSLRSRLKNPITFIKQRRRASGDDDEHVPSAAEYKEAGSIFGTRTHDWGSPRSPHEPPPAGLEATLQAATAECEPKPETQLQDIEPRECRTANNNKSAAEEDILKLEDKIDELIRETHDGLTLKVLPSNDDIASKGEQDINSSSSRSHSSSSSGSGRSAFSFEEDKQIGRNDSVNYHTTPADATRELSALAPQFQDEYYDDFDEIYRRNDGHLLGVGQFTSANNNSGAPPQHYPNLNTPNNTVDGYSGGYTSSRFREEDDDDDFYDSLLDEVNAVPDEDVDDVPPPLQRNNSRSSYNSVYTPLAPSSYYSPASRRQMLRKAKSYSFEGSRSQLAHNNIAVQRRQTSVIKSDTTTTTLFGKLPQETAPLPLFLNTQSSASFLSKKLSNASSLSNLTTPSTSNTSFNEGLDYYDNEAEDDDLANLELSYPSKLNTALTPISERSYDSDYSRSPV